MKKKIIAVAAVIAVLAVAMAFIISKKPSEEPPQSTDGQPVTVNIEPDTTKKEKAVSYNKKVTVTLPGEFIEEKYKANPEAFAEANGYDSVKFTSDGNVKVKMRAVSYSLLLSNIGMETIQIISYLLDSDDYPYFVDLLKYNNDFSELVISVKTKKYNKAENKDDFFNLLALACLHYQDYDVESKGRCKITVCENKTNILVETREFTVKDLENMK